MTYTTQKPTDITPADENNKTEFQIMERKDEELIIQELSGKEFLQEFVYSFEIYDKKQGRNRIVTNLSYLGIKEAVRERGHFKIEDYKIDETADSYFATIKIHDKITDIDVLGTSETKKDQPFARVLALNKAERNAYAKLLPAKLFAEMIKRKLQENPRNITNEQPQPRAVIPIPKMQGNKHLDIDPETLTLLTASTLIQDERLKQYQITPDGQNQIGIINVLDDVITIVPYQANLRRDNPAFTSFLFPKILDAMTNKYGLEYEVIGTQEGALLYILIKGKLEEKQVKELLTPTRWAFLKANEQNGKETNQSPI